VLSSNTCEKQLAITDSLCVGVAGSCLFARMAFTAEEVAHLFESDSCALETMCMDDTICMEESEDKLGMEEVEIVDNPLSQSCSRI